MGVRLLEIPLFFNYGSSPNGSPGLEFNGVKHLNSRIAQDLLPLILAQGPLCLKDKECVALQNILFDDL